MAEPGEVLDLRVVKRGLEWGDVALEISEDGLIEMSGSGGALDSKRARARAIASKFAAAALQAERIERARRGADRWQIGPDPTCADVRIFALDGHHGRLIRTFTQKSRRRPAMCSACHGTIPPGAHCWRLPDRGNFWKAGHGWMLWRRVRICNRCAG